ncbi:MAG: hypothetical protein DMG62_18595 [Acidobacteria bacterium]|nr:MAG: hypothetical protein DMG63_09920 [Acidobacteriota bacterium]PYY21457.1 MAG: hypothetical protein DMG62_18595 [Acidobacteriota bacterium]
MSTQHSMAILAPSLDAVKGQLKAELAQIPAVETVCLAHGEAGLYVWVGIRRDEDTVWQAIADVEERVAAAHSDASFDFHVVPLSPGRRLEDYVSVGQQIFHRAA